MEPPPGGPPDTAPPRLVATRPDSLAVLPQFEGQVEFVFDEVISEGRTPNLGTGTGDLEQLVILSPSPNVPAVEWERDRIAVRPDEGWAPNRVYRVELLPGVVDLRDNRFQGGRAVVTFTTGAPAPTRFLTGAVYDWTSGRPAANALVAAVLLPDSLAYRTAADSSGRFRLGPVPVGPYLVYGVLDRDQDFRRDSREAFDTVRVGPDTGAVGDIYAFPRDSVGPRIESIAVNDSVSAMVTFSQPLNPYQRIDTGAVRLRRLPDSVPVPIVSIAPPGTRNTAAADTAAADTVVADTAATDTTVAPPGRPPLGTRLVVRVAQPWPAGARYVLEIQGIENVSGAAADAVGVLVVPEERPAEPADTAQPATPDSLPPPPADSVVPPPADTAAPPP